MGSRCASAHIEREQRIRNACLSLCGRADPLHSRTCSQWTIFFLALITDAFRIVCLLWLFVSAMWLAFQLFIHREEAGMITKGEHVKIGALEVDAWSSSMVQNLILRPDYYMSGIPPDPRPLGGHEMGSVS